MTAFRSLLVVKFGGSVLPDSSAIPLAVREVCRHLESHERIIVVVSAFKHHTDSLERTARALCPTPAPDALAFFMGLGEMRSAAELTLALQGAGIKATLRMPWDVWFLSSGEPLDATPVAVSQHRFEEAFREHRIVVFPGFIGRGQDGRPHLLGRGGSDLTAIFLAAEFGADRCILLKDAPGIFEWDPAPVGPRPRHYSRMSWDDAIALGARMLKPEHAEYARQRAVRIEVMAPGSSSSTIVGPDPSELDPAEESGAGSEG
jgi:homoserine dehydrogenase